MAYANCSGGRIIFGVENNIWKITGIPQDQVFEKADSISNAIMDSCEPMIDFDIKYQTMEEKTIIIVQVYPGKKRPYYLKSEGIDEAYQFVLRNIRLGAEIAGLYRKDIYEIPIDSIREMLVNAVAHRLWKAFHN